jgi:hypothetical protein
MSSMTLVGLLRRGHLARPGGEAPGEARLERAPPRPAGGGRGWTYLLLADFPHLDAAGPGRVHPPNRRTQQVLEEAAHIIFSGHTTHDAPTSRSAPFTPQ